MEVALFYFILLAARRALNQRRPAPRHRLDFEPESWAPVYQRRAGALYNWSIEMGAIPSRQAAHRFSRLMSRVFARRLPPTEAEVFRHRRPFESFAPPDEPMNNLSTNGNDRSGNRKNIAPCSNAICVVRDPSAVRLPPPGRARDPLMRGWRGVTGSGGVPAEFVMTSLLGERMPSTMRGIDAIPPFP